MCGHAKIEVFVILQRSQYAYSYKSRHVCVKVKHVRVHVKISMFVLM